jgi:hypothetical protein
MTFVAFMRSPVGRLLRIVLGVALIGYGMSVVGGGTGLAIALVGVVPVLAGVFNLCLAAPLFGLDLHGRPRALR